MKLLLALILSCYCPLPHRGPVCDCDQHKMCSECEPIQSEVSTREPDREVQAAYEELARFASESELQFDVQHNKNSWTAIIVDAMPDGQITRSWKVTAPRLSKAVADVEKDAMDFPTGHERTE